MKPRIKDILQTIETLAPSTLAEKWDNVGLLVGDANSEVSKTLIGLDPTNTLMDEALATGADTIITHHPVIFKPIASILTGDPLGKLLQKALANNINIIACHTNLDSTLDGVSDTLAKKLGLEDLRALEPSLKTEVSGTGFGRIGSYPHPLKKEEFLRRLFDVLQLETVNLAGKLPEEIKKVALCSGSGSELAPIAHRSGADIYISAEIKHATAIWANEVNFAIIDGTHFSTEKPATYTLAKKLSETSRQKGWEMETILTETERHPFVAINKLLFQNTKTYETGEKS